MSIKHYLAFSGAIYYPLRGLGDLIGRYDDLMQAMKIVETTTNSTELIYWGMVVNLQEGKYNLYDEDGWNGWEEIENWHVGD